MISATSFTCTANFSAVHPFTCSIWLTPNIFKGLYRNLSPILSKAAMDDNSCKSHCNLQPDGSYCTPHNNGYKFHNLWSRRKKIDEYLLWNYWPGTKFIGGQNLDNGLVIRCRSWFECFKDSKSLNSEYCLLSIISVWSWLNENLAVVLKGLIVRKDFKLTILASFLKSLFKFSRENLWNVKFVLDWLKTKL